jgi:spermidine/putrescine transport system substrate-binding protein
MWRIMLACVLTVVLAACGNTPTSGTAPSATTVPPETTGTDAPPAATEASDTQPAASAEAASTGGWDCGDRSKLGTTLNIFSWADYFPEEDDNNILADFEEACGVEVTLDTYPSNEDMAARIRAGNAGYDIIVPSDYMVDILKQENRLLKLDQSVLTNLKNLDPNQRSLYYDPNNEYSVPFQYGMTGIAFDSTKVNPAPDSWAVLFDPEQLTAYQNQASMLDDEREGVGAALRFLGYSYNSTDPEELAEAQAVLEATKPLLAGYDSENVQNTLSSGEVVIAQAWNGQASLAKAENPNIQWIVPKEGGAIWQDNLAIPADAPQPYAAHVFINNVLDAAVGARITDFTGFLTPNAASVPLLAEETRALQFQPTEDMRDRLEWIERKGDSALYSDVWTAVKGQ